MPTLSKAFPTGASNQIPLIQMLTWISCFLTEIMLGPLAYYDYLIHERDQGRIPTELNWGIWALIIIPIIRVTLLAFALRREGIFLAVLTLIFGFTSPVFTPFTPLAASALIGMRLGRKGLYICLLLTIPCLAISWYFYPFGTGSSWQANLVDSSEWFIAITATTLLGILLRRQSLFTQTQYALGRSEERARISREMHDALAHHLSLISLHSTALAGRENLSPTTIADISSRIHTASTQASNELRKILHLLHKDGSGDHSNVHWEDIQAIIDSERAAGFTIDLRHGTDWPDPFQQATSQARHTALRFTQEALTNASKYGVNKQISLLFATDGHHLIIECTNPTARSPLPTPQSSRLGLAGLQERLELIGGDLSIRRRKRHFTLQARIPMTGSSNE
ncbi:MAG: histidine kinase [Actinomycetaceae bacterium]|nr:histidine kinase [Actinomycetaceae bacterium]